MLTPGQMLSVALICALIGTSYPYYAFFGCYFLCVGGIAPAIRSKRWERAAWGVGLAALIFAVLVVNESPNLLPCAMVRTSRRD